MIRVCNVHSRNSPRDTETKYSVCDTECMERGAGDQEMNVPFEWNNSNLDVCVFYRENKIHLWANWLSNISRSTHIK